MRVLAIDPGPKESAALMWDGGSWAYKPSLTDFAPKILPNEQLLKSLPLINLGRSVDVIAIEMVQSFGMSVGREVFDTVFWVGRFFERCPIEPRLVYRMGVKLHHCKTARAKDANIRQALIDKYGAPGTIKNKGVLYGIKSHLWSALAIATMITETEAGTVHHEQAFSAVAKI